MISHSLNERYVMYVLSDFNSGGSLPKFGEAVFQRCVLDPVVIRQCCFTRHA